MKSIDAVLHSFQTPSTNVPSNFSNITIKFRIPRFFFLLTNTLKEQYVPGFYKHVFLGSC